MAERADLDYDLELLEPGHLPGQQAFALVMVGVRTFLQLTEPDAFPAYGRDAKRLSKQVAAAIPSEGALRASVFMAHAVPTIWAEWLPRAVEASELPNARATAKFDVWLRDEVLAALYPLTDVEVQLVARCLAEFKVLDTHEVSPEVRAGVLIGTGYHRAVLKGENPDDDPELVRVQVRYAKDYALFEADRVALKLLLGQAEFQRMEGKLSHAGDLNARILAARAVRNSEFKFSVDEWRKASHPSNSQRSARP